MNIQLTGIIKDWKPQSRHFGFIYCEKFDVDYFFHISGINKKFTNQLEEGDEVSFYLKKDRNDKNIAFDIERLLKKSTKVKKTISKKVKISKYSFENIRDLNIGLNFIYKKLSEQKDKLKLFKNNADYSEIEEVLNELLYTIDDFIKGPFPNINDISDNDIEQINQAKNNTKEIARTNSQYWVKYFNIKEFGQKIEDISERENQLGKRQDFSIVWGQWRNKERQIFNSGYTKGHFNYSYIEKDQVNQTTVYQTPPPKIYWELIKITQKNQTFYVSTAPVCEIAQTSYVPSLPPNMSIKDATKRILDKNHKTEEWQREVEGKRILKIKQFIEENNESLIANTPMIFIKDNTSVKIENNKLTIDFNKFLKKQSDGEHKGEYIDRKKQSQKDDAGNEVWQEYRPLWIIDGQHRIKGVHLSDEYQDITVPIIIFPSEFSVNSTAKIFAEINTLQKKLNPLHELYMQHRFCLDHTNPKRRFRDYQSTDFHTAYSEDWSKDWEHSRANHLSYEILARLAQEGPLKDRALFLTQNKIKQNILVTADQWINYSRRWFLSMNAYGYNGDNIEEYILNPTEKEKKMDPRDIFFIEINNYFKAFQEICNHNEWKSIFKSENLQKKWIDGSKNKPLIQKKAYFIILIELYLLVRRITWNYKETNRLNGIIKIKEFMHTLKPFTWVDWQDKDLNSVYSGGGERGRRSLEVWMADAILHGKSYDYKKIHDSSICSQPGKGITAPLSSPLIKKDNQMWPSKINSVIKFTSIRPFNARYESKWTVYDENDDPVFEGSRGLNKHTNPQDVDFLLKYKKDFDKMSILKIEVRWQNANSTKGNSITLINKYQKV